MCGTFDRQLWFDRHVAAVVDLDPGRVEPEVLAVGDRPDREHHVRALDDAAVVAVARARRRRRASIALGPRALQQRDAAREELVLEHRRDLGVLHRQHLLARHEQRHLRAERVEHVRELDAGDARADDARRARGSPAAGRPGGW